MFVSSGSSHIRLNMYCMDWQWYFCRWGTSVFYMSISLVPILKLYPQFSNPWLWQNVWNPFNNERCGLLLVCCSVSWKRNTCKMIWVWEKGWGRWHLFITVLHSLESPCLAILWGQIFPVPCVCPSLCLCIMCVNSKGTGLSVRFYSLASAFSVSHVPLTPV